MEIEIIDILIYSILPTLIGLYITERVKGKVKSSFDKKLESLKKEHLLEIANFQAEIKSLKEKENFKFSKLHEKRFNLLEIIYNQMSELLDSFNRYIHPLKHIPNGIESKDYEKTLHQEYADKHNEFIKTFKKSKLYLNDSITTLIDNYINESHEIYSKYSKDTFLKDHGVTPDQKTSLDSMTAYKDIPKKIEPIFKAIEFEFKNILEK
jgi:hypothetical protein